MTQRFRRAAVVGPTGWGTTLAIHLARNGTSTVLVARDRAEAAELAAERRHPRRLPEAVFPDSLEIGEAPPAASAADLVCFAVPSRTLEANARALAGAVGSAATVLSATKGIEESTGRRMTELLAHALPGRPLAVLSGPNLSRELVAGLPGSTVVATRDAPVEALRAAFHSTSLRVYTSHDVIGVELGGALKNVIAIVAGMVDALGFGDNAKAAILTRGLAEMTRLGVACGAEALTFQGLAGIGDLVATAYSPLSRNRRLGELVAGGLTVEAALGEIGETAEGASTTIAALRLAARHGVEMPITAALERVLYEGLQPLEALRLLMEREPRSEH